MHPAMVAVNVPFNCLAPNPPEKIVAFLQRAGVAQRDLQQYREQVQALAKGFETAPLTQAWKVSCRWPPRRRKAPGVAEQLPARKHRRHAPAVLSRAAKHGPCDGYAWQPCAERGRPCVAERV
ncbi:MULTISPECIES: hypothetical protein [Comamonas]|uniref:hypothetical protein n=1 Tax=Comamonas TaxID=283 RepID=UPI00237EB8CC|nr:hypothetical protein [Comamonas aquatica]MDE1557110.1 hypothetical protein [Comamonas aquatica]